MRNVLNGSIIMRGLTAAAAWVDRQWNKSCLANAFLRRGVTEAAREKSIAAKAWGKVRGGVRAVFKALRLDRVFEGSVFGKFFFWCALAIFAAPVVPTMVLLALTAAAFFSLTVKLGCDESFDIPTTPVSVFVLLFALTYLVCSVASVSVADSLKGGLLSFVFIVFSVALVGAVKTEKQKDILVYAIVAGGTAVALYGLFQYLTGVESNTDWIDEAKFEDLTLRVYSTLENPNVLAEYLLLVIPLAVTLIFTEKGMGRVFGICASSALIVCMFLTYSRGGWLGLIAAAALFLVVIDRRFIVLGVIGAAALLFVLPESVLARFASITDMSDSSTTYRIAIWLASLAMLGEYWFCGIGTGTEAFNTVYPAYSFNAASAKHAHNLYLQIACECGIVGIFLLLAVMFVFFRTAARALCDKPDTKKRLRLIALMAGMFGFAVQSVTDHSFYNYRVMFMFWVIVALGMIIARGTAEAEE